MKIIETRGFVINGRQYKSIAEQKNGALTARVMDVQTDSVLLFHEYGRETMKTALNKIEAEYRALPRVLRV